jgi:hypothetical protein
MIIVIDQFTATGRTQRLVRRSRIALLSQAIPFIKSSGREPLPRFHPSPDRSQPNQPQKFHVTNLYLEGKNKKEHLLQTLRIELRTFCEPKHICCNKVLDRNHNR